MDVVERLLKLADIPISKTRDNMSGQVSALKSIAEIQGYILSKDLNYDRLIDDLTEERSLDPWSMDTYHKPNTMN